MPIDPQKFRVNVTLLDLPRDVADKIIEAAADIAGRVSVSMATISPMYVRGKEGDHPDY